MNLSLPTPLSLLPRVFGAAQDYFDRLREIELELAEMRARLDAATSVEAVIARDEDNRYLAGYADGLAGRQAKIDHGAGAAVVGQQRRHLALVQNQSGE